MRPSFKIELNQPLSKRLVDVAHFEHNKTSLAAATTAGKVLIHTPHEQDPADQIRMLNINRNISALATGRLSKQHDRDYLFVGAQTTLLAYDVRDNRDAFFKDTPDGVNAIAVGRLGERDEPLVYVGGNCSILGYDARGEEAFWTVTGDNVSAMAFCDVEEDGQLELLVGSDDFEIRVFRDEEVLLETTETDRPTALAPLHHAVFGYALSNGTVGVYDKPGARRWRVKTKHVANAIAGFDLDGDGHPELVTGWSNGKLEVRSDRSGEVLFKDAAAAPVAAILQADYRSDGKAELLVCGTDGEVRGYSTLSDTEASGAGAGVDAAVEEEALRELQQRKQEMLHELRQLEESARKTASGERTAGLVAADTNVSARLEPSKTDGSLDLVLAVSNQARIRAAVVFAERLFEGESIAACPKESRSELRVPLRPQKDVAAELDIKVVVGGRNLPHAHVFELTYALPKFCMHVPVKRGSARVPAAGVSCSVAARADAVAGWLQRAFGSDARELLEHSELDAQLVSLRSMQPLAVRFAPDVKGGGGVLRVLTDDMDLAGEIVQDFCTALGLSELETIAEFPEEMRTFRATLQRVDEFNAVRVQLTAEMADTSSHAKMLVIKAEDSRILGDMDEMRAAYSQLRTLNAELIGEYNKRANNHEQLLAALKDVNHMIQKAARLRFGPPKQRVVSSCRAAIKSNNIQNLFSIIKSGNE